MSLSCRDSLARSIGYEKCSTTDLSKFPVCEMMTPTDFRAVASVAKLCGALDVGGGGEPDMKPALTLWFKSHDNIFTI